MTGTPLWLCHVNKGTFAVYIYLLQQRRKSRSAAEGMRKKTQSCDFCVSNVYLLVLVSQHSLLRSDGMVEELSFEGRWEWDEGMYRVQRSKEEHFDLHARNSRDFLPQRREKFCLKWPTSVSWVQAHDRDRQWCGRRQIGRKDSNRDVMRKEWAGS